MPTDTVSSIMSEIDAHMRRSGIPNRNWYVGITSDVEKRLFGDHRVPRENHWYIGRPCANASEARALEAAYHRAFDAGLVYLDEQHRMQMNEGRLNILQGLNLAGGVQAFREPLNQQIFLPPDLNQRPLVDFIRRANTLRQIQA